MNRIAKDSIDYTPQTPTKPTFENLLWSRPERPSAAGKLLIIGGSATNFLRTQAVFAAALAAGVGQVKACLPRSIKKLAGEQDDIVYVDDTPSGSIAESALPALQEYLSWADGLLLPGELSNNSETELLIAELLQKIATPTVANNDVTQLLWRNLEQVNAEQLCVICNYRDIQRLIVEQRLPIMLKQSDSPAVAREVAAELQKITGLSFIIEHQRQLIVAVDQQLSQTPGQLSQQLLTQAAVLATQFPARQFEALTTAVYLSVANQ